MKQKKFTGIYEYYRSTDPDKATTAYYISVRDQNTQPKKIKTEATTPECAAAELARYKATRLHATIVPNHKMTLSQLADKFFKQRTTANNQKDKRRFELHAEPILGKVLITKLSKRDIKKLQQQLQQKQVASTNKEGAPLIYLTPKTINSITDITNRIMQWGYDQELVPSTLPKVDKLRVDNERQRVFTNGELGLLFNEADGDTLIFLRLMYHTAQRPESILRLKKKHIINGSILIEAIKHQSSHTVPVSSKLAEIIDPWISNLTTDDYIITKNKNPMPYQTMSGRVSKMFGKLFNKDLDYKADSKMWASLYTLRHTALTNIYATTSDIYAAQAIANHSSVQMTQRYAKRSEQLKRNAVEGL